MEKKIIDRLESRANDPYPYETLEYLNLLCHEADDEDEDEEEDV